jgi:hypothetical protein
MEDSENWKYVQLSAVKHLMTNYGLANGVVCYGNSAIYYLTLSSGGLIGTSL